MTAPSAPTQIRLDSLTGLRFAAALVVFLYHAGHYLPAGELGLFGAGMTGVSLFYLLSGFVMAWVWRANDTPIQFYRRRFARIYPVYFVAVSAAVGVSIVMRDFSPTELSAYTLLQSWSPDPVIHYAASPVFWSLSCEAFFYAVFPLAAEQINRLASSKLWRLVAVASVAVIAIGVVSSFYWDHGLVRWLTYIFPPTRLLEFVLGVALGILVRRGYRSPVRVGAASVLALASVLAASFAPGGVRVAAITIVPFMILITSLASRDVAGGGSCFSRRSIVQLGVWSYCFYLIHAMLQGWVIRSFAFLGLPAWSALIVAFASALGAAWVLHVLVERPFERRLRPRSSPRRLDDDGSVRVPEGGNEGR